MVIAGNMIRGISTTLPDRAVPSFLEAGIRGQLWCPGHPLGVLNCFVPLGLAEPSFWRGRARIFQNTSLALLSPRSSDTGNNPQPCACVCGNVSFANSAQVSLRHEGLMDRSTCLHPLSACGNALLDVRRSGQFGIGSAMRAPPPCNAGCGL